MQHSRTLAVRPENKNLVLALLAKRVNFQTRRTKLPSNCPCDPGLLKRDGEPVAHSQGCLRSGRSLLGLLRLLWQQPEGKVVEETSKPSV